MTALVLSCSGGGFVPVVHAESFRQAMAQVRSYQEFAKLSIEQDGFPQRQPALRFLFESMAQLNHDFDMSRAKDIRSMQFDLAPIAKGDIPTLLIGAEDDNGANTALTRIHEAVAGSKLVIIPSAGHLSFFESADAYNRAVLEFLSKR